jgi:hypothetical protein
MAENCIDNCGEYKILPDPDLTDWFCDDDVKVLCKISEQFITIGCRPHYVKKECEIPEWCPKRQVKK